MLSSSPDHTILNSNFKLNSTLKLYTVVLCGDGKTFPKNFTNDPSDVKGEESFKHQYHSPPEMDRRLFAQPAVRGVHVSCCVFFILTRSEKGVRKLSGSFIWRLRRPSECSLRVPGSAR